LLPRPPFRGQWVGRTRQGFLTPNDHVLYSCRSRVIAEFAHSKRLGIEQRLSITLQQPLHKSPQRDFKTKHEHTRFAGDSLGFEHRTVRRLRHLAACRRSAEVDECATWLRGARRRSRGADVSGRSGRRRSVSPSASTLAGALWSCTPRRRRRHYKATEEFGCPTDNTVVGFS
jgi:hypothetical protein